LIVKDHFTPRRNITLWRKICQSIFHLDVKLFSEYSWAMDEFLTTKEAAEKLRLTLRAVQKMIESGRLEAQKVGRDYIIRAVALENISRASKAGRPPKSTQKKQRAKK
jgi:excisionase family DNA binding protein